MWNSYVTQIVSLGYLWPYQLKKRLIISRHVVKRTSRIESEEGFEVDWNKEMLIRMNKAFDTMDHHVLLDKQLLWLSRDY